MSKYVFENVEFGSKAKFSIKGTLV